MRCLKGLDSSTDWHKDGKISFSSPLARSHPENVVKRRPFLSCFFLCSRYPNCLKQYRRHGCSRFFQTKLWCFSGYVNLCTCSSPAATPSGSNKLTRCGDGGVDRRSLQREAQHIGHFVGIDKDDWMCSSVLIVFFCDFGVLGTVFFPYKPVRG